MNKQNVWAVECSMDIPLYKIQLYVFKFYVDFDVNLTAIANMKFT